MASTRRETCGHAVQTSSGKIVSPASPKFAAILAAPCAVCVKKKKNAARRAKRTPLTEAELIERDELYAQARKAEDQRERDLLNWRKTELPRLVRIAQMIAREHGFKHEYKSSFSSYYRHENGERLRISDHEVPLTNERRQAKFSWTSHGTNIVIADMMTEEQLRAVMSEYLEED